MKITGTGAHGPLRRKAPLGKISLAASIGLHPLGN